MDEYAKSPLGLWVRARSAGLDDVVVEVQERVAVHGGMATGLGADGEVRWEASVAAAPPAGAWYEVGRVAFAEEGWRALEVPTMDWPRVVRGVQRHVVGLIADGWGDAVAEVVRWFVAPLAGASCVVPARYRVLEDYGALEGFRGLSLRPVAVQIDDEGEALFGEMWADVIGIALPRLEVPRAAFVRAMLVATVPIVE